MTQLLTDRQWAPLDGKTCRVLSFTPCGQVKGGTVIAASRTMPYAFLRIKSLDTDAEHDCGIVHKIDFAMLWAAYNDRGDVPAVTVEHLRAHADESRDLQEVWITWSKRDYKRFHGLFAAVLPRLTVMVVSKEAYRLLADQHYRPELDGLARAEFILPRITWRPDVKE